jgi:hypothetical protein
MPEVADVSLKDAFDIYQKQSDSLHKLWAYFQVISLAVLGYTIGSDKAQWEGATYLLIAISYIFFAAANQWAIVFSQRELNTFATAVAQAAHASGPVGRNLSVRAIYPRKVALFHTVSALIVLAAICAAWIDKSHTVGACPKPPTAERSAV